ncbi:unnamed protein product [Closterium sp. Naga37s-1]|nr:unnamed protein product [Closterium sp. Naga37s-1]
MRGLSVFISDIRNCQNKEQERLRVDKELANIRTHFKAERKLTPYEKKKYVWKLLYIFMLGYDVDFGHMEAVSLISAPKYAEKQVGYMVTSCLLNENNDFLRLVINSVRNDIIGRNETFQCLALTMVGNIGGKEFSESVAPDVQKLLLSSSARPLVKKKAALCLLRLFRKNPDIISTDTWPQRMASLLEERSLSVLLAAMSLLVALVAANPEAYLCCVPKCVKVLERLAKCVDIPQDYTYYAIPSPWLQVKTMRVLQYFPSIEDPSIRKSLLEVLARVLQGTEVVKNVNKNNAAHAILFEALALAMHMDVEREVMAHCVGLLGKFVGVREPNIRYLALENMARMLMVADVQDDIRGFQSQIVHSLKDPDMSIRRRALDLLYGLCDTDNAKFIVEQLLQYLTVADFVMREELTLKTAILAEKFAVDLPWYVDVILCLMERAGDFVSEDVWYRVVQIVTNNDDLQPYAASRVLKLMRKPAVHETMVKVGSYILGEFSHLLPQQPGSTAADVFAVLHDKFHTVSIPTRALMLSAYVKLAVRSLPDDALHGKLMAIFTRYESSVDAEVQQRAVEYASLCRRGGPAMADIVADMPKFPQRESSLLRRAPDNEGDSAEVSAVKLRAHHSNALALVPVSAPPSGSAAKLPSATAAPAAADGGVGPVRRPQPASSADGTPSSPPPSTTQPAPAQPPTSLVDEPAAAPPPAAGNELALALVPADSANAVGDLLGELLSLDPSASNAPAAAAGAPAPGPAAAAGAGGLGGAEAGAMALTLFDQTAAPAAVVQPLGSVAEWFRALMGKDSGVLYEDAHLQIGVKSEWKPPHGRLVLFMGNKETAPLTALTASTPPTPGLRVILSPLPQVIPPRAQIQLPVEAAAVLVPREAPRLDLAYTLPSGTRVPLRLHLPVGLCKALLPASLSSADFFARWKTLSAPPHKQQVVLRGVKPLPLPALAQLLASMRINPLPNLDPNPNNIVACCTLHTETTPPTLLLVRCYPRAVLSSQRPPASHCASPPAFLLFGLPCLSLVFLSLPLHSTPSLSHSKPILTKTSQSPPSPITPHHPPPPPIAPHHHLPPSITAHHPRRVWRRTQRTARSCASPVPPPTPPPPLRALYRVAHPPTCCFSAPLFSLPASTCVPPLSPLHAHLRPCPVLPCPFLPLPSPALPFPPLPSPALPFPPLPSPSLPCPPLPSPSLPFPPLPCPACPRPPLPGATRLKDFISDNISELPPAWLQPPPVAAQQQQGGAAMLALPWSGAPAAAAAVSSPPGPIALAPSPAAPPPAPHMVLPGGVPPPAAAMAPMPYGGMPMQGPGMGMAGPMGMGGPGMPPPMQMGGGMGMPGGIGPGGMGPGGMGMGGQMPLHMGGMPGAPQGGMPMGGAMPGAMGMPGAMPGYRPGGPGSGSLL